MKKKIAAVLRLDLSRIFQNNQTQPAKRERLSHNPRLVSPSNPPAGGEGRKAMVFCLPRSTWRRRNDLSHFYLFFLKKQLTNPTYCVDFTRELKGSLDLFHLGFLATYFPHFVAATLAFLVYVIFIKSFSKPKKVLGLFLISIIYLLSLKAVIFILTNYLSYCL